MTVSLLPTPRLQFTDAAGAPLVGGTVATYQPGTFTLATTWQDSAGTIANPNPIILDALGSAAIWGSGNYRVILSDALGNLIFDAVTTCPATSVGALLAANNLSDVASPAAALSNLGAGTAATQAIGTSGATLGLLSTANTTSGANVHNGLETFAAGANLTPAATPATTSVGYLGVPQGVLTANYTLAMVDAGNEKFFGASVSCTIPNSSTVAFPIGTVIKLTWDQTFTGTVLAAAGVTLRNPVGNVTGTRTVTGPGFAVISLEKANEWWVCGGINIS